MNGLDRFERVGAADGFDDFFFLFVVLVVVRAVLTVGVGDGNIGAFGRSAGFGVVLVTMVVRVIMRMMLVRMIVMLVIAVLVPRWQQLLGDDDARGEQARVAAIAKWLEDLRDLLRSSSAGAEEALEQAAARASTAIAVEMEAYRQHRRHGMRVDEAVAELGLDLHHRLSAWATAPGGPW